NSKGGGLASSFSSSNQIMGVRKTTDVLEKTTWTLAVLMVVLSIFSAYSLKSTKAPSTVMQQEATQQAPTNPNNSVAFPAAAPTEAAPATPAAPAAETPAAPAN
ncbi:MAG: preprotein translocase subunit SecG, partial [Bacteroidales bacterium]|nr:preprotein translocase subunit SecG [Candidatus Minthousia equi]